MVIGQLALFTGRFVLEIGDSKLKITILSLN